MSYIKTGLKRSLTASVSKEVNGSIVTGYPRVYNGQTNPVTINLVPAAVSALYNQTLYPTITSDQLGQLSDADYAARLTAFKAYISSIEAGINFSTDIIAGFEPVVTDMIDCLPPVDAPTTTVYAGSSTTSTTQTPTTQSHATLNINILYGGTSGVNSGFSGTVVVFENNFNTTNPYQTSMYITTSVLYNILGHVVLDGLLTKVAGSLVADFKYWKLSSSSTWINFTSLGEFNLNIPSEVSTVDIDILITNIALETTTTSTTAPVTTTTTTFGNEISLLLHTLVINSVHTDKLDFVYEINNGTSGTYDTKVRVKNVTRGSDWVILPAGSIYPHTLNTLFSGMSATLIFANIYGDTFDIDFSIDSGTTWTALVHSDMGSTLNYDWMA